MPRSKDNRIIFRSTDGECIEGNRIDEIISPYNLYGKLVIGVVNFFDSGDKLPVAGILKGERLRDAGIEQRNSSQIDLLRRKHGRGLRPDSGNHNRIAFHAAARAMHQAGERSASKWREECAI